MFYTAPHIHPTDIVADEVLPGAVLAGGLDLTVFQTPGPGAGRGIFFPETH